MWAGRKAELLIPRCSTLHNTVTSGSCAWECVDAMCFGCTLVWCVAAVCVVSVHGGAAVCGLDFSMPPACLEAIGAQRSEVLFCYTWCSGLC